MTGSCKDSGGSTALMLGMDCVSAQTLQGQYPLQDAPDSLRADLMPPHRWNGDPAELPLHLASIPVFEWRVYPARSHASSAGIDIPS